MPRIDNSIEIKATPDTIFPYLADIECQPEWVKWAKRVEVTSLNRKGVGATDAMVMQVGPQKQNVEGLVTEYKDGEFFTRRLTKGMDLTERLAVVKYGEGSKVAYSVEYTPPMGAMGKMIDMLFMERLFDQLMKDSLTNLRGRLESAP
jgi:uncharacterized membrane protein